MRLLYRVLQETWKISLEFGPNLFRIGSNYLVICEHSIACRRAGASEKNVSTPRAAGISRYIVNREAASEGLVNCRQARPHSNPVIHVLGNIEDRILVRSVLPTCVSLRTAAHLRPYVSSLASYLAAILNQSGIGR